MYLIYVDEYGTSGGRLDNPHEPYFALQAAIVEEKNWNSLERDILALQAKAIEELDQIGRPITKKFEFHAAELLQGKGNFNGLHIERQIYYAEQLLQIAANNKVQYFNVGVEKLTLDEMFAETFVNEMQFPKLKNAHVILRARFSPYSICFCYLLAGINKWLSQQIERGLLIFDESSQYGKLATLGSYAFSRVSTSHISNILAAPFFTDSKVHTPLQVADLVSYFVGRNEVAMIRSQDVKPEIVKKFIATYIKPFDVSGGMHIGGQEIHSLIVSILEEMWPAEFDDPEVRDYCKGATALLAANGQITSTDELAPREKKSGDETLEGLAPVT